MGEKLGRRGVERGEGSTEGRKDARVVINTAAALRTKKLWDRLGGGGGGGGGGAGGVVVAAAAARGGGQKQTFLESRYPVSRVSRYWFDTYQL